MRQKVRRVHSFDLTSRSAGRRLRIERKPDAECVPKICPERRRNSRSKHDRHIRAVCADRDRRNSHDRRGRIASNPCCDEPRRSKNRAERCLSATSRQHDVEEIHPSARLSRAKPAHGLFGDGNWLTDAVNSGLKVMKKSGCLSPFPVSPSMSCTSKLALIVRSQR